MANLEDGHVAASTRRNVDQWVETFGLLWHQKGKIGLVAAATTIIALAVALLLPEQFRSTAVILPETDKSKLGGLGGFSDLIESAGISWGGDKSPAKLYPTIVKSESVLKNVLYRKYESQRFPEQVDLIEFLGIDAGSPSLNFERALNLLRSNLDITLDNKTNVLTVSFLTTEPQISADIVNTVVSELDKFIRTKRITSASEQRKWIESRLSDVKKDLARAENVLREFRENNRRPTDSPNLLLEQERLIREVTINSSIYVELKRQLELVKIEEIKNLPIINIMDAARPAARKEYPRRLMIVLSASLLGILGSSLYFFISLRHGMSIKHWISIIKAKCA